MINAIGWLQTIKIPADTISIGEAAFCNEGLQSIEVDENNSYYSSEDGILFNKDKTTLLAYPSQRKRPFYLVPSSVTEIADCAFVWADIGQIFIPASVTKIGDDSFFRGHVIVDMNNPVYSSKNGYLFNKDQTYLIDVPRATDKIFIPKCVERINIMIFENCDPLKFVIYCYENSYGHEFAEENEFNYVLIDGGMQTQIHIEVNVWERTIPKR
ncbi:leucine-rich repeat protein [Paenibacillus planticolens]|uniref:leucine-rich repeat protein n=1 Tax=Paenibacillus planticolens TaxID=2654976 RepID=UPI001491B6AE|nr:leucine-rich repeat protein [Paenibacillus planticolens]